MIDKIRQDQRLFAIIRNSCEEHGVKADLCDELLIQDEVNDDLVIILKIDAYYNTIDFAVPPPAPDCLIIFKNNRNEYFFYIIELKSSSRPCYIDIKQVVKKFETAINTFMSDDFSDIFLDNNYKLIKINAWLLTNCFNHPQITEDIFRKKIKGSLLDYLSTVKPFKFNGIFFQLEVIPTIKKVCY